MTSYATSRGVKFFVENLFVSLELLGHISVKSISIFLKTSFFNIASYDATCTSRAIDDTWARIADTLGCSKI